MYLIARGLVNPLRAVFNRWCSLNSIQMSDRRCNTLASKFESDTNSAIVFHWSTRRHRSSLAFTPRHRSSHLPNDTITASARQRIVQLRCRFGDRTGTRKHEA
jgi:hypothetical protein